MTFLNHLRIRTRLLLAILLPVLLTACVLAWIARHEVRANGAAELERLEHSLIESRKRELKNLVSIVRDQVLAIRNDPALSDQQAREAAAALIRSIRFDRTNYVYAYTRDAYNLAYAPDPSREGPTTDPGARRLVGELFAAAAADGFHAYLWGNPATGQEESKISYTVIIPDWDWMVGAGVYLTDIEQDIAAVADKIDRSTRDALWSALLVAVPVVLLSLVLGALVARTVSQPLLKVSDTMKDIAEGEGDLRQRLPEDGTDEVAELGRRFNHFVSRIQDTIREVGQTTEQLASAAETLSVVARETRQSVDEQGSETDQIASAINEMAATIQQIAGNASDAENAASDADRMARDGRETIAGAQEVVNQLSAGIQETARSIDALAEKSNDIQGVLDVIHAVTEQTNLLALNAAIEAARAGEHGRGFSVVADEVRQLARRSAESADQIRDMIDGFVTETRTAVERMKQSRRSSDAMVERITHATEALHSIETSVARIHDQVTQIATGAEQQTQVANEINENVVGIVDAAQRSGTGVARTNEASQDLARLGERLRSLVGQFRV